MSDKLTQLAEEAIRLELNIARLYLLFHDICPEDIEFWRTLVIEENNHAALIRSGIEFFVEAGFFPVEILPPSILELHQANQKLLSLIEQYDNKPPSREEAFKIALETERSAGEIHFQRMMTKSADSRVVELFQKLNLDDKDHAKRIQAYMVAQGI